MQAKIFAAVALILPTLASAGQFERLSVSADAGLVRAFGDFETPVVSQDAFQGVPACAVVDARAIVPFTVDQAKEMLAPCVQALSARYSVKIGLESQVLGPSTSGEGTFGLALVLEPSIASTSKVMRDLNHGLRVRDSRLLGLPVSIVRSEEVGAEARSAVQAAIDDCIMFTVVRKIRNGDDFIKNYGSCIKRSDKLKIKELRASAGHKLGVTVVSAADESVVSAINGFVTVNAGEGPVHVMILAYSESYSLPLN